MGMKKAFRRTLCAILSLVLICPAMPVRAVQIPSISITSAEAEAGQRAEMEILISGSPGISGASLSLSYDRGALNLAEIRPLAGGLFSANTESGCFSWLDGSNKQGDFALAVLVFDVSAAAHGEYEISLALTGGNEGNLTNQNAEAVEAHFISGSLMIGEECPSAHFSDLKDGAWYHEAIDFVLREGLMLGTGTNSFAPNTTADRAMVVTTLYRMAGSPETEGESPYTDAPDGRWYSDALLWAWETGLAEGYGNGLFGPGDSITREQLAVLFLRCMGSPDSAQSLDGFSDSSEISFWAAEAMSWAVESGLMQGRGNGIIAPKSPATRAELAQLLMNFCNMA